LHYCRQASDSVIPNVSLAGSILSRKHGLGTFVHVKLEWTVINQPPAQSETDWLCVKVAGYNIIKVCKTPTSRLTATAILTFPTQ